jgi:hypothetical protein
MIIVGADSEVERSGETDAVIPRRCLMVISMAVMACQSLDISPALSAGRVQRVCCVPARAPTCPERWTREA